MPSTSLHFQSQGGIAGGAWPFEARLKFCNIASATNLLEVIKACEQHDIDLAVLGHVLNVNEKRRITSTVRSTCTLNTPVLALYQTSPSEAGNADAALAVQEGTDTLVKTVARMLESRKGYL